MVLRNQQTDALIFYMLFFRCEPLGVSTSSSFQNSPETLGSHPIKICKRLQKSCERKPSVAAAVAILVVPGSLVTAQALGIDVFGAIARWTDETFRFSSSSQNEADSDTDIQNSNDQSPDGEYTSLRDALAACGIKQNVIPQQLPNGFGLSKVSVYSLPSQVEIEAIYTSNDRIFSLTIFRYNSPDVVGQTIFEKDSEDMILYEKDGIAVYIMSNDQSCTAAWMPEDLLTCAITGDLTVEEIEAIIDSM